MILGKHLKSKVGEKAEKLLATNVTMGVNSERCLKCLSLWKKRPKKSKLEHFFERLFIEFTNVLNKNEAYGLMLGLIKKEGRSVEISQWEVAVHTGAFVSIRCSCSA